jgi:hypothetical protein
VPHHAQREQRDHHAVADIESAVPGDLYKVDNDPDWEITRYVAGGRFRWRGHLLG